MVSFGISLCMSILELRVLIFWSKIVYLSSFGGLLVRMEGLIIACLVFRKVLGR